MDIMYGGEKFRIKKIKNKIQLFAVLDYFTKIFNNVFEIENLADLEFRVGKFPIDNEQLLIKLFGQNELFKNIPSRSFLKFLDAIFKVNNLNKYIMSGVKNG